MVEALSRSAGRVSGGKRVLTAALAEAGGSTAAALPDGLKIEEASALLRPGSRDGEIKVVSEDGGGVAYSWNAAQ